MEAKERLFITSDKKRLVKEGDPKGAFLYAAPGDEIPQSAAEMFGLIDGKLPSTGGGKKREDDGGDKRRKGGQDKSRKPGDNKDQADLTEIKGIGAASAKALAAAGIDSFEKLAAIDPEAPPAVEGLGVRVAWAEWVKAAAEKVPPADPAGGGLTINELPNEE